MAAPFQTLFNKTLEKDGEEEKNVRALTNARKRTTESR